MKCVHCQAILLPVEGELFCLQCGRVYLLDGQAKPEDPVIEETDDPVLQQAISDGLGRQVDFRLPVQRVPPKSRPANLASLREHIAVRRPAMAGIGLVPVGVTTRPVAVPTIQVDTLARGPSDVGYFSRWVGQLTTSRFWAIAIPLVVLFALANILLDAQLQGRAYPGVRVAGMPVGGQEQTVIEAQLRASADWRMDIQIGGQAYQIATTEFATGDTHAAVQSVMQIGRQSWLPLVGLVSAWFSEPVALAYQVQDDRLQAETAKLAKLVDRPSHDASLVVIGTQVLVLPELTGTKLDQSALAVQIRGALARKGTVSVSTQEVLPLVSAASLQDSVQSAQRIIDSSMNVAINKQTSQIAPAVVAGWVRFDPKTHAVGLDGGSVAAYIAALSGRFDRNALYNDLMAGVLKGQPYTAVAGGKPVAVPKVVSSPRNPVAYSYCLDTATADYRESLAQQVGQTLDGTSGWALNGQVVFVRQESGCNMSIRLQDPAALASLGGNCAGNITCRVGPEIAILESSWHQKSSTWKDSLAAYRAELINHEVGHVLGFDHPGCLPDSVKPTLSPQNFNLGTGCSPVWHVVQTDALHQAVLPGFAG